jgi:hypothetical protein
VALAGAGLAFLAATLEGAGESAHADYTPLTIATYISVAAGVGLAVAAASRGGEHAGVIHGASAGLRWGASDVSIKGVSGSLDEGLGTVLLHPLAVVILIASLVRLLVSARSLQLGDPVPVIAVTSVAANTVTIAAGPGSSATALRLTRPGGEVAGLRAGDRRRRADPGARTGRRDRAAPLDPRCPAAGRCGARRRRPR